MSTLCERFSFPKIVIAESCVKGMSNLKKTQNRQAIFSDAVPFYISASNVGDLQFLCAAVFYFCHPKSHEAVSPSHFNLHFPSG